MALEIEIKILIYSIRRKLWLLNVQRVRGSFAVGHIAGVGICVNHFLGS